MNPRLTIVRLTLATLAIASLTACDGDPIPSGTVASVGQSSSQSSLDSQAQPLADLSFADAGLAECVMATGKAMSDEVTELKCSQTIADLDGLGQLYKLEDFEPQVLSMQVVDFSEVPQLKKVFIGSFPNESEQVQLLDLSKNTALEELWVVDSALTSIDLSANKNLKSLNFSGGTDIENLDLSTMPQLERLHISIAKKLEYIDLSELPELSYLRFSDGLLKEIDLSNNPKIQDLALYGNELESLNLSSNTNLIRVHAADNKIADVIWGDHPELIDVYLDNNLLAELEVVGSNNLEFLDVSDNPISRLDVTNNTKLSTLKTQRTKIPYIDLSKNIELDNLYIYYSEIDCETAKQMKAESARPEQLLLTDFGADCGQ